MAFILPSGKQHFETAAGAPLSGGKLYAFVAGTSTPKNTYTDSGGLTANAHPVVLDSRGEATVFWSGAYDVYLKDAADVTIWGPIRHETPEIAGTSATLRAELASSIDGDEGGGLVGFSHAVAYPEGTLGHHAGRHYFVTDAPWNAKFDGSTDDTTAINTCMDYVESLGGGTVHMPRGSTIVTTLYLRPYVHLYGAGSRGGTILTQKSANTRMFMIKSGAPTFENVEFGRFLIKAHASGSTGTAVDMSGARNVRAFDIEYFSNGSGNYTTLFSLSSHPNPCYQVVFDRIRVNNQTGPVTVWDFNNNGQGSAYNCNAVTIRNAWIVDNATGMLRVIDGARSACGSIAHSLIEGNTLATAVSPGQGWTIGPRVWFETNTADISFEAPESGSRGENVAVFGCYFSNAHNIDMSVARGVHWFQNTEAGKQTWVNNNGLNFREKVPSAALTAPTIARDSGVTGTLALVSATVVDTLAPDRVTYKLVYTWTASATGMTAFAVSSPTGYTLESGSPAVIRGGSGEPMKVGIDANALMWLKNEQTDAHTITLYAVYRRLVA